MRAVTGGHLICAPGITTGLQWFKRQLFEHAGQLKQPAHLVCAAADHEVVAIANRGAPSTDNSRDGNTVHEAHTVEIEDQTAMFDVGEPVEHAIELRHSRKIQLPPYPDARGLRTALDRNIEQLPLIARFMVRAVLELRHRKSPTGPCRSSAGEPSPGKLAANAVPIRVA